MNKGTLCFFVWKYFFCINAGLKQRSHFAVQGNDLLNTFKTFYMTNSNTSLSNKTKLTSVRLQLNPLHVILLVVVKATQKYSWNLQSDESSSKRPVNLSAVGRGG